MAARPLGNASKAEQARRLVVMRELWPTDMHLARIAERLGLTTGTVSHLARTAGLPSRRARPEKIS
jgi:hypothetical protein